MWDWCGSQYGYQSQFISTTTSLAVAHQSPAGTKIVEMKEEDVLDNTENVFDLTTQEKRDELLNYQRAKGFAANSR